MRLEDNPPTRWLIARVFQMLRVLESNNSKAMILKFEKELKGYMEGFIDRNGTHPLIPKGRSIMDDVVDHHNKKHKDRKAILNMVNGAWRDNTLPAHNIDLGYLRLNLLKKDYVLTPYDHELIEKVINTLKD